MKIRIAIENLVNRDYNIKNGTSVLFKAHNTFTNQHGFYKQNGAMQGAFNEDIKEKLISQVLSLLEIESTTVNLIEDVENDSLGHFSVNFLQEGQVLKTLDYDQAFEGPTSLKDFIEAFKKKSLFIPGLMVKDLISLENNLCNLIYFDCMINHYNRKIDNIEYIASIKDSSFLKPSPWYDYGASFAETKTNSSGVFEILDKEEVLEQLFENYFDRIIDLHTKVNLLFAKDSLDEIFNQSYLKEGLSEKFRMDMLNLLKANIKYANNLYEKRLCQSKKII